MRKRREIAKRELKWVKKEKTTNDNGYTHASQSGFYNTSAWRRTRQYVLANEPFCRRCMETGRGMTQATLVDHIVPLEDDVSLGYELDNLQPLCDLCHRIKTNKDKQLRNIKKAESLMDYLEE